MLSSLPVNILHSVFDRMSLIQLRDKLNGEQISPSVTAAIRANLEKRLPRDANTPQEIYEAGCSSGNLEWIHYAEHMSKCCDWYSGFKIACANNQVKVIHYVLNIINRDRIWPECVVEAIALITNMDVFSEIFSAHFIQQLDDNLIEFVVGAIIGEIIQNGNYILLKHIVSNIRIPVEIRDNPGTIYDAICHQNYDIAELLISDVYDDTGYGARVNVNYRAVLTAQNNSRDNLVEWSLDHMSTTARQDVVNLVLLKAVTDNNIRTVRMCLRTHLLHHIRDRIDAPFSLACRFERQEIIDLLLDTNYTIHCMCGREAQEHASVARCDD